ARSRKGTGQQECGLRLLKSGCRACRSRRTAAYHSATSQQTPQVTPKRKEGGTFLSVFGWIRSSRHLMLRSVPLCTLEVSSLDQYWPNLMWFGQEVVATSFRKLLPRNSGRFGVSRDNLCRWATPSWAVKPPVGRGIHANGEGHSGWRIPFTVKEPEQG